MPTTWTLEDLYRGIARGWKALAITIVLCLLLAFAGFRVFPERYAATAVHTVEPISVLSTGSSFATVNMDTEQIVATSTGVLQAAADAMDDGATARDLADATQMEVPRGSQVLRFIVTTASPSTSAEWANAIASAYGDQRAEAARDVVEQTSSELQRTIDELRERLDASQEGTPEYAATELQLEALVGEQARLLSTPFYSGSLITPAVEPNDSTRPALLVFLAGGLFLGLLLGSFAALAWASHAAKRAEVTASPAGRRARSRPNLKTPRHAFKQVAVGESVINRDPAIEPTARLRGHLPGPTAAVHRNARTSDVAPSVVERDLGTRAGRGLPAHRTRQRPKRQSPGLRGNRSVLNAGSSEDNRRL